MTLDVNRSSQVLKGSTYAYNYDNGDKLTLITSGSCTVKSYGYDAAGRTHTVTTSAGTTTLSYDYEDRVTGITYPSSATNSFTYNGLDTRVGKVDSTGTSTYKRDGADVTDPVLSDGSIAYTPGVSERKSGTSTFDHGNYLGTYRRQTNASQTTTATRVYDAFGNLESTTGSPQSGFGFVGGQGYQEDGDSGLKLLGHRYYDPSTGRFLTRDPAQDGRDWYAYSANAPTFWVDETGLTIDIGGTGTTGQTIRNHIHTIDKSKRGHQIISHLKNSKTKYHIVPINRSDPHWPGYYNGATHTIAYDPTIPPENSFPTGINGRALPTPADVILEHELGHAVGNSDNPHGPGNPGPNVNINENPYRKDRGLPKGVNY